MILLYIKYQMENITSRNVQNATFGSLQGIDIFSRNYCRFDSHTRYSKHCTAIAN